MRVNSQFIKWSSTSLPVACFRFSLAWRRRKSFWFSLIVNRQSLSVSRVSIWQVDERHWRFVRCLTKVLIAMLVWTSVMWFDVVRGMDFNKWQRNKKSSNVISESLEYSSKWLNSTSICKTELMISAFF